MSSPQRRYWLERDTPDPRDHNFAFRLTTEHDKRKLPARVDLRDKCLPAFNQGNAGTCTAHAIAGAYAYLHRVRKARHFRPSPRFVFYNEMAMTGQLGQKCVVRLRDALKAVAEMGVCPESHCRYKDSDRLLHTKPQKHAFEAARKRRVVSYHRILIEEHSHKDFLRHLKHCLADGYPFVFGFLTYESFDKRRGKWKDGIMPIPQRKKEKLQGGHAVMGVGYDDSKNAFVIRNSWGPEWGKDGYFLMPYELISNPIMAFDFWTIRDVTG